MTLVPPAPKRDPQAGKDPLPRGDGRHHVVVVGGGFAGLAAVRALAKTGVRITLIDQSNHHLFQPLLYQVATTILAASDVAWPLRGLMRGREDVTTVLADVTGLDADRRRVCFGDGSQLGYDTLVLATGARHHYFGHDDWEHDAPGLKTLGDAIRIRERLLMALEQAERSQNDDDRAALQTFAIIGGGATGVELAGIIAELTQTILPDEFRRIDTRQCRIVLIEAGPRLLPAFSTRQSRQAELALARRGVELRLGQKVTDCTKTHVALGSDHLPCRTTIWAAGVRASPAAEWLGCKADRAGRVIVGADLTVPDQPSIFVIGDTAAVTSEGASVPGIAPAAKQQGSYVGKVIAARLRSKAPPPAFRYRHRGDLATVGKRAAVVRFGSVELTGALAWWIWGLAHIYYLIGTRSRASVAINWLWTYLRGQTSARLIAVAVQTSPATPEITSTARESSGIGEHALKNTRKLEHPPLRTIS